MNDHHQFDDADYWTGRFDALADRLALPATTGPVRALPAPGDRSRVADAMSKLRQITGAAARPATSTNIAQSIAADLSTTIRDAVAGAVPYGRSVTIEADIGHQGADGSKTAGRVRIVVGGRE